MSSDQSSSDFETQFSFKRYFINNLDSYHGAYILGEMAKILEKNVPVREASKQTMVAEDAEPLPPPPPEMPYEIIGTVSDPNIKSLDNVSRIIPKAEVLPVMITCGTVILDVSYDREELRITLDYLKLIKDLLEKQVTTLSPSQMDVDDGGGGESKKRYLILISTVMTWAVTKPLDPDTTDMPFIESDFRKRKPHPNYKMHYDAENEVVGMARKYRTQIGALVVCSGVTYGGREDVLFYWFQKAWECERLLPLFGRGSNAVPLINVLDLAQIVYNLVNDFPKKLYILAVEQTVTKQREIVKPLGRACGTGMFKCIPPEDAFLIPEVDQRIYDLMTLNLNMEPTFIVETMGLQWTSELTFAENVSALMKQFKQERGLKPFKVVVYGPPLVGKTTLSKQICENYGLLYVSVDTAIEDIAADLEWRIAHWDVGETAALGIVPVTEEEDQAGVDDDDVGEEESGAQEAARQTLTMLRTGRAFTDEEVMGGEEQDSDADEENEEEQFDEDLDLYSGILKKMLPDIVVYLEATDDYICEKAMRQPDGLDEEVVLKRLTEFRAGDTRDVTPLNFFDELDIHPLEVPVKDHLDYAMKTTYAAVALRMGRPCRYGKLLALIEAAEKRHKEEMATLRSNESKALKALEKKMREDREDKMEYWSELYALMREEEEVALAAAGEPMRNYLVHHIFPTLTPALLEVAKLRPNDPIDFLAEHLFKLNPSGKMLEPGYNLQAERLLGKIKILDEALRDLDIKIDPLVPPEADLEPDPSTSKKNLNSMSNF